MGVWGLGVIGQGLGVTGYGLGRRVQGLDPQVQAELLIPTLLK